jgi:hypothetical protein
LLADVVKLVWSSPAVVEYIFDQYKL